MHLSAARHLCVSIGIRALACASFAAASRGAFIAPSDAHIATTTTRMANHGVSTRHEKHGSALYQRIAPYNKLNGANSW